MLTDEPELELIDVNIRIIQCYVNVTFHLAPYRRQE